MHYGTYFFLLLSTILYSIPAHPQTWHDVEMTWDAAPVDVSFLFDAPAGKHGFLGVKDGKFVFEDGARARFWGTTVTGSGCFPPQTMAPKIADRLARLGFNLVRFHWLDAEWADPPLIVRDHNGNPALNPQALDRLDFFLFQLENRGVYAFIDGLDARTISEDDAIIGWQRVPPGWKGYIHFADKLRNLHANLLDDFWTHRSPYSGWDLRQTEYRDEPTIALAQLFEANTLNQTPPPFGPFLLEFDDLWRKWTTNHNKEYGAFDFRNPSVEMRQFLAETTAASQSEFGAQLRSLGVKAPVSGTDQFLDLWDLAHQIHFDYITAQSIWNRPFGEFRGFPNRAMTDVNIRNAPNLFTRLAFSRLKDKPFVVSSWGAPWPNRFRAETPLWMAATANAQDWDACIASTLASGYGPDVQHITAPFEMINDPSLLGLMPAAALLFHQHQNKPHRRTIAMSVTKDTLKSSETVTPDSATPPRFIDRFRIETVFNAKPNNKTIFAPTQPQDANALLNQRNQPESLRHDPDRGLVLIQTNQTLAAVGRLNKLHEMDVDGLRIETDEAFGVISLSSLDEKDIRHSSKLLVTVVSESRNTGFRDRIHPMGRWIESPGAAPVQIRKTPARVFLETRQANWAISAVDMRGNALERLPYQYDSGMLSFRVGSHPSVYYLLQAI